MGDAIASNSNPDARPAPEVRGQEARAPEDRSEVEA